MDLDYLSSLSDAEFEKERQKLIELEITKSKRSDKLRQLQWRIDGVRRKAKTPLKACIDISDMMWESFYELNDRLQEFKKLTTH